MNNIAKEIEAIQQELDQLYLKKLELAEARPSDLELHSINDEIVRLERDEENHFKILQAAASVRKPNPEKEKDWTMYPFYSHTVRSWNFAYPPDQI